MPKTQIVLVSEQAAPAFLPALDPALRPECVVLVVSPTMKQRGRDRHLGDLLRRNEIKIVTHELTNEHDYKSIEDSLITMALDRSIALGEGEVYLNLTGGTKMMALAAHNVARQLFPSQWRPFYLDLDTNQIVWIGGDAWPDRKPPPAQRLGASLRLRNYLYGYGFDLPDGVMRKPLRQAQSDLIRTLVVEIASLEKAIGRLNGIAAEAEELSRLSARIPDNMRDRTSFEKVVRLFGGAGCLELNGDEIRFQSENDRSFVKGGWLESYVSQVIDGLHGSLEITDKATGLKVIARATGTKNELDVCFLRQNRLYVIECKTARMIHDEKANDSLYKLAEIHSRVGGIGARGMLVSYRAFSDAEMGLAKALGIRIVQGSGIENLKRSIHEWVQI